MSSENSRGVATLPVLLSNSQITIKGDVTANLGEKDTNQLYLRLSVENTSSKVMKDFSISFNSNKFGFLPASDNLFIYLNAKEKADVTIPLVPNRIVGGPTSTLISARLTNSLGTTEFTFIIPFHLLFVEQDAVSMLNQADFDKRWERIPVESEKTYRFDVPPKTDLKALDSLFHNYRIYSVSSQDSDQFSIFIKILSGYGFLGRVQIKNSTLQIVFRTAAVDLFSLLNDTITDIITTKIPTLAPLPSQEPPKLERSGTAPAVPLHLLNSQNSTKKSSLPQFQSMPNVTAQPQPTMSKTTTEPQPTTKTALESSTTSATSSDERSDEEPIEVIRKVKTSASAKNTNTISGQLVLNERREPSTKLKRKESSASISRQGVSGRLSQQPQPPFVPPKPHQFRALSSLGHTVLEWTVDKRSGTSFIGMGLLGFLCILASMFVAWYAYPTIDEGLIKDRLYKEVSYSLPKNHIPRAEYQALTKSFLETQVLGISVLTGPSGCGKTTSFKSLLNNRPLSIYFAMREVCDRALRIECFMRDFLSALGLGKVWGVQWLKAIPSVKTLEDLKLDELRWLYITGLRTLRAVLKSPEITSYAEKLGIRPVIIIDDAQYLLDLAEEGQEDDKYYGKGIIQELLNAGILISQEDSSANFVIVSNYDYSVRYFQRNYDGVQNGRLSEAEINFGDAVESVAIEYLEKRANDAGLKLSPEIFKSIYNALGGRFDDLSRVPLKNPDAWISVREEELKGTIAHLLETNSSSWCTHAKMVMLLQMLKFSPGYIELDIARKKIDDPADLCIEQLVSMNIITRRNYGRAEDLSASGATKETFYLTSYSPLMQTVLKSVQIVLQLKVRDLHEDQSEARTIELQDISIVELKKVIAQTWNTVPERIQKIKSRHGRIEKDAHILNLNHDDMLVVAFFENEIPQQPPQQQPPIK